MKPRIRMQRLHVFSDGDTNVIAFDPDDAKRVYMENSGMDEWDESYEPFDTQRNDNEILSICAYPEDFDDLKRHRPPFSKVNKGNVDILPYISAPAWLWCLWHGRSFLSSTEF